MNAEFARWWDEWAARNEALYVEAQRERELAVARRWARAHIRFWFGDAAAGNDKVRDDNNEEIQ